MPVDKLLSCLDKVRRTGDGRWVACCPHHADKSPSLAIRELGDSRVLIHCFAGCPPTDILASIGMTFHDIMPERMDNAAGERLPFPAHDVLAALAKEIFIARIICGDMMRGKTITAKDRQRLGQAYARIRSAEEMANGRSRQRGGGAGRQLRRGSLVVEAGRN